MTIYDPISEALDLEPMDFNYENLEEYIDEEYIDKIIPWNVGISEPLHVKEKKSKTMKLYWTEERRSKKSRDMIDYNCVYGTQRYSEYLHKRYANTEFKAQFTKKMNTVNKCPNKRKEASEKIKEKWKDPEYVAKMKNRGGGRKSVPVVINDIEYKSISEAVNKTNLSYHSVRKIAGLVK